MIVGYNYAWPSNKFGRWLGPDQRQDLLPQDYRDRWKDLRFKESIRKNLATLLQNGVTVVRWFLLGNGWNYGPPPTKVEIRSGKYPTEVAIRWRFDPPSMLDPLFLEHFRQLLDIHRELGMKMIPSLVSFEFFATDKSEGGSGGRGDIATDWRKRNTFLFSVLGEFLRVSADFRSVIYAWEVINEPAWDLRWITPTLTGNTPHVPYVQLDSMKAFIYLSLKWMEDKRFESTVGHRFLSDFNLMPTGSKPQFHYYATRFLEQADPGKLPIASAARRAFVGEFGALIGKGYEQGQKPNKASYGKVWETDLPNGEDKDPRNTVYARLKKLKELNYELALVWPEYDDLEVDKIDGLKISPDKLAAIKRFVDSR
jgi:hypothetical protein